MNKSHEIQSAETKRIAAQFGPGLQARLNWAVACLPFHRKYGRWPNQEASPRLQGMALREAQHLYERKLRSFSYVSELP